VWRAEESENVNKVEMTDARMDSKKVERLVEWTVDC